MPHALDAKVLTKMTLAARSGSPASGGTTATLIERRAFDPAIVLWVNELRAGVKCLFALIHWELGFWSADAILEVDNVEA